MLTRVRTRFARISSRVFVICIHFWWRRISSYSLSVLDFLLFRLFCYIFLRDSEYVGCKYPVQVWGPTVRHVFAERVPLRLWRHPGDRAIYGDDFKLRYGNYLRFPQRTELRYSFWLRRHIVGYTKVDATLSCKTTTLDVSTYDLYAMKKNTVMRHG